MSVACVQPRPLRLQSFAAEGRPGASAYELALRGGFVGTEAQWLASLRGSGLPELSAEDDGKLLAVVNGAVAAVSPESVWTDGNEVSY